MPRSLMFVWGTALLLAVIGLGAAVGNDLPQPAEKGGASPALLGGRRPANTYHTPSFSQPNAGGQPRDTRSPQTTLHAGTAPVRIQSGGTAINLNDHTIRLSHDNYQPAFTRHRQYQGYWNGNYGDYATNGSGSGYGDPRYRPIGWGLGAWGLGALAYNSGYLWYSNPYYNNNYDSFGNYNYSQPLPVAYSQVTEANIISVCDQSLNDAVAAFRQKDYDAALGLVNNGINQCPDDSVMHEFRALVLFAKGDYQQAAATIHSVLAVGPGWNWTTLCRLYADVSVYTTQLRALEAFTRANPQDGAARFLQAYHYLVDGYPDAAARELEMVVRLDGNDRVAEEVLRMVNTPRALQPARTAQQSAPQTDAAAMPAIRPIAPAILVGTWQASRDDGSHFEMTLKDDATFNWKFTLKGKVEEFGGTYKLKGNILGLQRKEGGALIAGVVPDGANKFNFKLLGAPQEDPGLNFSK